MALAIFAAPASLALGLAFWAYWLSRREGAPRALLHAAKGLAVVPVVFGVWIVVQNATISSKLDAAASERARVLAEGISVTMNGAALAALALLPCAVVLLALTWRYRRSGPRQPPAG